MFLKEWQFCVMIASRGRVRAGARDDDEWGVVLGYRRRLRRPHPREGAVKTRGVLWMLAVGVGLVPTPATLREPASEYDDLYSAGDVFIRHLRPKLPSATTSANESSGMSVPP